MTTIKATIQKIGVIHCGVDGSDEYLLAKTDEPTPPHQLKEWLLKLVYKDTTQEAGGYFCHNVTVMARPYMDDEFVAIIHHRYDV